MGRVEQYHTLTRIVNGYKFLPIIVPTGIKPYPYPYPFGWVGQIDSIDTLVGVGDVDSIDISNIST
jgi:hypothetical protein